MARAALYFSFCFEENKININLVQYKAVISLEVAYVLKA